MDTFFNVLRFVSILDKVTRLSELLIENLDISPPNLVVSPAMGGLVIGQEVARQLGSRFVFLEKKLMTNLNLGGIFLFLHLIMFY